MMSSSWELSERLFPDQNVAREEGLPAGFEFNETKNIWYFYHTGARPETPESMRCEAMSPPILPEPSADPGQCCAARGNKCRQLTAEGTQCCNRLEEFSPAGLIRKKAWSLFRNRVSNDWVWTARATKVPHEAAVALDNKTEHFFTKNVIVSMVFHPIREGGIGLPKLQTADPAARAASWAAALDDVMRITNTATAGDLLKLGTLPAHILEDMRGRRAEAAQHIAPASMTQPRLFKPTQNKR